jgi:hypothetical protein
MLGTKERRKKILPATQNLKEKKKHFECMLGLPHWLHEIFISKTIGHHFWPGLIPPL